MVNRCVRKSFSIVLDAIVEITIGAQRAALRKHRDEPSAFVTPWERSNARGSSPWHAEPAAPNLPTPPKEITLLDIHQAVESTNLDDVIGIHERGNHTCPVARNIHDVLKDAYAPVAKAMSDSMREVTLANMLADYRNRIGVKARQLEQ